MTSISQNSARKFGGLGPLLVGLAVGGVGGAAYRGSPRAEEKAEVVEKAEAVIREAFPIVLATALDSKLPPPPGGNYAQSLRDEAYNPAIMAERHTESFGRALEAFREEARK